MKSSTSNPKIEEKTEIVLGSENTIKRTLQDFSLIKERFSSCIDVAGPSIILSAPPVKDAFINLKKRRIITRFITEITKDNLSSCKELIRIAGEVRHLDGIKGNFGVTEFSYIGNAAANEDKPLPQLVLSTVRSFVEQQQYFFDMLWDKAIPAWQKIRELEEGWIIPFHDTLYEPKRVVNQVISLVKSTKKEILLVLSADVSDRLSKQLIQLMEDKVDVKKRQEQINIKILINSDQKSWYKKNPGCKSIIKGNKRLKIRFIESLSQFKVSMIVVDKETAMSFQIGQSDYKNKLRNTNNINSSNSSMHTYLDNTFNLHQLKNTKSKNQIQSDVDFNLTFGTYTNSKSIVESYTTIFETLWYQIDLYKQVIKVCKFLQRRDKDLQEFLSITAHEISNPLQSILGLSDILVSQHDLNRDYKTMLNAISKNATKLHILSKDVLDTARLETKSIKLQREDYDIIHLVKSIIKDFKNQKQQIVPIKLILDEVIEYNKLHNAHPNLSSSSSFSLVANIDPQRIAQVITNLLNNAVNFTTHGVIKIFIEIDRELSNIRIKVTDTGTGIDRKIISRLFTKFVSTSKKGSGLGLYICKNIVELHGGKIWAENNKHGPGSTFTFTIPIN